MPRTRSLAWSELKIGVLTIAAIVITTITIFMLTGTRGFFWQRYNLKARFTDVAGLKGGSPVRVAGVEVGTVTSVEIVGEVVEVAMEVNEEQQKQITTGSTASLGSVSLLGESAVDITPSTRGTPIPEWGYVPPGRSQGQLFDIAEEASAGIEEVSGLVHDIRLGRGTMGKLVTDDRLYAELHQFVASAGDLTRSLREGRGTLGRLLNDRAAAERLEASLGNVERMTAQLEAGQGTLGKLLKDDALAESLSGATSNLQALTARLNRGEGTVGKLLNDQSLFNQLNEAAGRFDALMTRLNAGEGTAGLLLKDRQLYENMNAAVSELRNLVTAIQKDPKKYLNVKVSIF